MDVHVDLFGCKYKDDVLLRFDEILQFGGPRMNVPAGGKKKGNLTIRRKIQSFINKILELHRMCNRLVYKGGC